MQRTVLILMVLALLTLVASSVAEITWPSFHELRSWEARWSASWRKIVRSLSTLKNSNTVDLMCLCTCPTIKDMEFLPTTFSKAGGKPCPNNFASFFNTKRFNSGSAETILRFPNKWEEKIFPNLQMFPKFHIPKLGDCAGDISPDYNETGN